MRANTFSLQILHVFKCPVFKALNNSIFMFTLGQNIFCFENFTCVSSWSCKFSENFTDDIKSFK